MLKNPSLFFENLDSYKDEHLTLAFLSYNKYMRRIKIDYPLFHKLIKIKKKKNLFSFFTRG
jgi:hypothetical protein